MLGARRWAPRRPSLLCSYSPVAVGAQQVVAPRHDRQRDCHHGEALEAGGGERHSEGDSGTASDGMLCMWCIMLHTRKPVCNNVV